MRLSGTVTVPILGIIVGGSVSLLMSGVLLLSSPAEDVTDLLARPTLAEPSPRSVASGELTSQSTGLPQRVVAVDGDTQAGVAGELLPNRVRVLVTDDAGDPIPGAEVRFEVKSGGGVTAPSRTLTDSHGQASALWRLGMETGSQTLSASAGPGLESVATFTATARQ